MRLSFAGFLLLAGCHTAPQIIQTGPDTFMAGANTRAIWKSDMKVTSVAMDRASAFCAKRGQVAQMTQNQVSNSGLTHSDTGQVQFVCVAARPPDPSASAPK